MTVTDTLPKDVSLVSAVGPSGSCAVKKTKVTCAIGALNPAGVVYGGAPVSITIVVVPRKTGTLRNTATVAGDQKDPAKANNQATATTTILGAPTCRGLVATVTGSPGDDHLTGTAGPDVIVALGGSDFIEAGSGRDLVCAGGGRDRVRAGSAADRVFAGAGGDRVLGQGGPDVLRGAGGSDVLKGGRGSDRLRGGRGFDRCRGGAGAQLDQRLRALGDGEEAPLAGGALQGVRAAVVELEAGADDQLAHGAGDEQLAGVGQGADPGADVDRHPADVVADQLDLAGVDPTLTSIPIAASSSRTAAAQRIARAGPSKVARNPSPIVFTSRPRWI